MITDEEIRDQFKDTDCLDTVVANRKRIEGNVDALVSRRKTGECKNLTSLDGWDIKEFAPDALFSLHDKNSHKDWCFRYSDINRLLSDGVNPYTGVKFTEQQLSRLKKLNPEIPSEYPSLPLSIQLRDLDIEGRCPLWRGNSPVILYSYVCDDEKFTNDETYNAISVARPTVTMASRPCIGTLYRIVLKEPYQSHAHLLENPDIVDRVETVGYGDIVESSPRPSDEDKEYLSTNVYPNLKQYMSNHDRDLPEIEVKQLYLRNLRPDHTITLYRGLNFPDTDAAKQFFKKIGRETLTVGDKFTYKGRKNADSWSTNVCLATSFAMHGGVGVVLKYVARPEEIILDVRRVANRKDFYRSDQAEIILSNFPIEEKMIDGRRTIIIGKEKYTREVEVYFITKRSNSYWEKELSNSSLSKESVGN